MCNEEINTTKDAPAHYVDCVACIFCQPPDDVYLIEDLPEGVYEYLVETMGDEPEQHICASCLMKAKAELLKRERIHND